MDIRKVESKYNVYYIEVHFIINSVDVTIKTILKKNLLIKFETSLNVLYMFYARSLHMVLILCKNLLFYIVPILCW